jgi:DNA-binding response OmpR family regulator
MATPHSPRERPVLVVEDDAGLRAYMVAILEQEGHRVIAAGTGEEALAELGTQHARLAVLDIGLPGMDGFAVADSLAADVPVLIVTGDPVNAYARAHGRRLDYRVLPKATLADVFQSAVAQVL